MEGWMDGDKWIDRVQTVCHSNTNVSITLQSALLFCSALPWL